MKKLIPTAIVISAALVLGACGSSASNDSTSKSSSAPEPSRQTTTTVSQSVMIDAYVMAINDWFGPTTRSEAIKLGKTMCDTIDIYGNVSDTVDAVIESGMFRGQEGDVGYIMGTSIPVFCPEYEAEARSLFR